MTMWSRRLNAVPYYRWTLGAATALDHWIAVDVLGMSEDTWKNLLRGDPGGDEEIMTGQYMESGKEGKLEAIGIGNAAHARDIVAVRASLFPETIMSIQEEDAESGVPREDERADLDATQRSIDELLASLGGFEDEEDESWKFDDDSQKNSEGTYGDIDTRINELTDELQEWRAKNAEKLYAEWDGDDKKEFNTWLSEYIKVVTTDSDGVVDLDATREALLSQLPSSREESDTFWSHVEDETKAEIFLQTLLAQGDSQAVDGKTESDGKALDDLKTFLSLPYDRQLRKLIDMGTLRPIFDEYTLESDRLAFMQMQGEALLEGTEVEHLVSDPDGPIHAKDIGEGILDAKDLKESKRFRIERRKYGTDIYGNEEGQLARQLFRAWNEHKAGRAMFEESMFKKGKLSLEDTGAKSWVAKRDKKRGV